jgi:hypothetical protein
VSLHFSISIATRSRSKTTTYHRPFDYAMLHALATAAGYRQIHAAGLTQRGDGIYRPVMLHAWK